MRLLCVIWHCSVPTLHFSVSHDTNMYYIKLFCPKMRQLCSSWDSSVPHETALSYMRQLFPTWDSSISDKVALSHMRLLWHMRLLCAIWDCFVLYETVLSHMRLLCPTWSCSLPHETVISLPFLDYNSFGRDWFVLLGTGTYAGLGQSQDWIFSWRNAS